MTKTLFSCIGLLFLNAALPAQLKTLKPTGFNVFSPEQDIQLGQEAKAEIEKKQPVWHDPKLDAYLADLGKKMAASSHAGQFPFSFEVVKDKNINAFALPGGPIFINTATFIAASNEAQLAGVIAHEMSHVALRHGTNQASKGQMIQLIAGLAGKATASGGMIATLAKAGIGVGANSLLLRYSRDAESQADYNGAQIMADAGYDPIQMAEFFQKLETRGSEGALAQFLSDHPTPGNRVKAVSDEVAQMPKRQYNGDSSAFREAQQIAQAGNPK